MSTISTYLNLARSNRTAFVGMRVLAVAASVAACASLAGCGSDMHGASNASPWTVVGNNGGKADRAAVARLASPGASMQVASAPAAATKAQ